MELFIFACFHAAENGQPAAVARLRHCDEVVAPSRAREQSCVAIQAYCSVRDPQLFYIHLPSRTHCSVAITQLFYVHSRWKDAAAFIRASRRTAPHRPVHYAGYRRH